MVSDVEGQMSMGQEKESVMDPLHPDLPLNVFVDVVNFFNQVCMYMRSLAVLY